MAIVQLSSLLTNITGSLAGSVFQNTWYGLQLRTRVRGRNEPSLRKQRTRQQLSYLSRNWRNLTFLQQRSWMRETDNARIGKMHYIGANQLIQYAGQPILNLNDSGGEFDAAIPAINSLTSAEFLITIGNTYAILPADNYMNIYVTKQLPSQSTFIGKYQYLYLLSLPPATDLTATIDIFAQYSAEFNAPAVGKLIGLAATLIDVANGQASHEGRTSGYVS